MFDWTIRSLRAAAFGVVTALATAAAMPPSAHAQTAVQPPPGGITRILVADLALALVVHPSVPAKTLKELVDYAKANPDKLSHMAAGNGTLSHLMMEDFKQRAGIRVLHVPYKGSPPAMLDLIAGAVQVGLDTVTVTQPHVKAERLRLIVAGTRLIDGHVSAETPRFAAVGLP